MARYVLTPCAQDDLRHISAYVRRDSPEAARRVRTALRLAIQRLADMPALATPARTSPTAP